MASPTLVTIVGNLSPLGEVTEVVFRIPTPIRYASGPDTLMPSEIEAPVAADGTFSIQVPGTNDPQWSPANWTYYIRVKGPNLAYGFYAQVPYDAGTLNFSSLLPAISSSLGTLYAAYNHGHSIDDISDLQVQLDGKQPAGTYLVPADITNLVSSETLTESLADKADLVGGVIPTSQIPAIAVTDFLGATGSQAAMLALSGQKGDWTIRTDLGQQWIITGNDPTQLSSWTAVPATGGGGGVSTVNGQTGTVVLGKADVGLGNVDNVSDVNKPVSNATQTALNLKANTASLAAVATSGDYNDLLNKPAGGGGGGAAVSFVRAQITSGDVVPGAQASWTPMAGLTLAIPAAAGDQLTISMSALLNQTSSDFFELVVLVGGSIVRYSSTNSSTPSAANEGDPSIYPLSGAAIRATTASWNFVATAGDISGGNVTFALAFRGSGAGKAFASTNYPFRWWARNDRAGAVGSTIPGIMRSGSRYAPVFTTFAPPTVVLNEIRHVPIDFYSACTITELACEVTAAVTNAMVRLLVSKAGSNGRPSGNYLYVSPQLVASAVGKVGTGAISVSIAQPGRYFFAALPQVAVPTLRSIGQVPAMYEQASMATYNRCCYSEYGVSGTPVTVGGLSIDAGDAPRVECLIG